MLYLSYFEFPDIDREWKFFMSIQRKCYDSFYPFQVLSKHALTGISFEPITILYGGTGSGKSTALNVMAEKLRLERDTLYNRSNFFEDYTDLCTYDVEEDIPRHSRIITSDDVFDYMLNLRSINEGIDAKREEVFQDYLDAKYANYKMNSLADYENIKKMNLARRRTQSKYVRENLADNIREHSNGESAYQYFSEKITEDGLYLLDEPENSLSPARQQELVQFLEDSVRFFGCQFIIATHSPFLLSMKGAKIYDLDADPVQARPWTELPNVRAYYDFFKKHENEFF